MEIDVSFDFTTDTKDYWVGFWGNRNGLGVGNSDPDASSSTLKQYHRELWSKRLPNGDVMQLEVGPGNNYLTWNDFRFGSDSITASFRYHRYKAMINQLVQVIPDYCSYVENYIRKCYTIGGTIIFPKHRGGINPARGFNKLISDRWDLTLECIRRYYQNEPSPLYNTLMMDQAFFELFVDFRGYVDFFFLQDCVSSDYSSVVFWIGDGNFASNPLPQSVDEYKAWIAQQIEFVERRNARIAGSR